MSSALRSDQHLKPNVPASPPHGATCRSCMTTSHFQLTSATESDSVLISDSVSVLKSRLITFLFNQALTEHLFDLLASVWRYRNSIIIIIIIIIASPSSESISNCSTQNSFYSLHQGGYVFISVCLFAGRITQTIYTAARSADFTKVELHV